MRRVGAGALSAAIRSVALLALAAAMDAPLRAQVSLEASVASDYRLRGYSLSRREPAVSLTLGYDDRSGLFGDVSAVAMRRPGGGVGVMGGFASLGYAARIGSGLAADAGVRRAQFSPDSSYRRKAGYTEFFAGLTGRDLAVRLSMSPDYIWARTTTLYVSGELVQRPADKWRVVGHAGLFAYLRGGPTTPISSLQTDWAVRVGRQIGRADLEIGLSGGGPDRQYFDGASHTKFSLVGTARWAF